MYGEGSRNFIVDKVDPGSTRQSRFQVSDRIVSIEGIELTSFPRWKQLESTLKTEPERDYMFVLERDDKKIELTAKARSLEGADTYSEKEYPRGFSNQPLLNRLLIVVAGPGMNFLLPFVFLPIVFMIGITVPAYLEQVPVIGYIKPGSQAAEAGFRKGDKIIEIEGKKVSDWKDVNIELQTNPDALLNIEVEREGATKIIPVKATASSEGIVAIGIGEPLKAKVGTVVAGTPADKADLVRGDEILSIDGTKIADWDQMSSIVKEKFGKSSLSS
jgi:regulator of sigma E protease